MSWNQTLLVVVVVAVAVLLAGLVVILARSKQHDPGASVVRSWIAISLVLGLVLFCAFTFAVDDASLRSTLIGGLTASVGSAIAYYFSSKASEQSRQDVLNATVGTESVPDLRDMTEAAATTTLGRTTFKFEVDPRSTPTAAAVIDGQTPAAGSTAPRGSSVTAHFAP